MNLEMFELAIGDQTDDEDEALENGTVESIRVGIEHHDVEEGVQHVLQEFDHFVGVDLHESGQDRRQLLRFAVSFQQTCIHFQMFIQSSHTSFIGQLFAFFRQISTIFTQKTQILNPKIIHWTIVCFFS